LRFVRGSKSAGWIARFDGGYGELSATAPVKAAREAFIKDRTARLMDALPEFEAEIQKIDRSAADAKERGRALVRAYLSWDGDLNLQESLEYDVIAARVRTVRRLNIACCYVLRRASSPRTVRPNPRAT
jgi:hypothetical protein